MDRRGYWTKNGTKLELLNSGSAGRPLSPLTLRFRVYNELGTFQSVVNHMELNLDVNITWKENVRKIWQFMFAGYADFLRKNKVHVLYLRVLEFLGNSYL